ncbi:MAG TPA: enoyl-CoA hydratase/isomerase family protein [Myxococcota bacterium]|nr:enoyl-CoA hydratase/isomerase family protein [Myxococcota bacterium]
MSQADLQRIRVERDAGVAFATIDAPPLNLLGGALFAELGALVDEVERDPAVRVLVLRSADPDFFIAHGDVETILRAPQRAGPPPVELPFTHRTLDRLRSMPKLTIAQIEGMARGGGSEVALACDLRFAARGKAIFGQPEVALGILPGAGGTYRLTRLLGRARACEVILSCADFSADEAERLGWINRALPPDELGPYVERLARRIAGFPALALAEAKRAIDAASHDVAAGLLAEQTAFERLMADPASQRIPRMRRFLELGCQTRSGERAIGASCEKLGDS